MTLSRAVLAVLLFGLCGSAPADGFKIDRRTNPVGAVVVNWKGQSMQSMLYYISDKQVIFATRLSKGTVTWNANLVGSIETSGMGFVYDKKLNAFVVVFKGKPSAVRPPVKPSEPSLEHVSKPTPPSKPSKPKDRDDEKAQREYESDLRDYDRKVEQQERDYKRKVREAEEAFEREKTEFPAKLAAFEVALAEWPAKKAAEDARIAKVAKQIQDVEKQFEGKVKFALPTDGHTTEDVDTVVLELQKVGR